MNTDSTIRDSYQGRYTSGPSLWRDIGGRGKAANLREVSAGRTFRKVLDVGAGDGAVLSHLAGWPGVDEFHAVELSASAVEVLRQRRLPRVTEVKQFDGYRIPYPDGFFDLAYSSHVVEHVEHPRLLLREIARVSRFQAFEVPCDYHHRADRDVEHLLSYGHINLFDQALFRFLLRSEGFTILADRTRLYRREVRRHVRFSERPVGMREELRFVVSEVSLGARALVWRALGRPLANTYTALCRKDGSLKVFEQPAQE